MGIKLTKEEVMKCIDVCTAQNKGCRGCKLNGSDRSVDRNDMSCVDYLLVRAKELIINNTNKGEEKMAVAEKRTKEELLDEIKKLEGEVKRLERFKAYDDQAGELKGMYVSYMNAGFTKEQAFDLVKIMLNKVKLF